MSTPLRQLQEITTHTLSVENNKQASGQQMRIEYLEKMLKSYKDKTKYLMEKNEEANEKVSQARAEVTHKNKEIALLQDQIAKMKASLQNAQKNTINTMGELTTQRKVLSTQQVQSIRLKQQREKHEKINKLLTSENHILLTSNTQFKHQVELLEAKLQELQVELEIEKKQSTLLQQMNSDLKLQVENLLFELKTYEKRRESSKLSDYEVEIEKRNYLHGFEEEDAKEDNSEIVELLEQKIEYLEFQLNKSDERCKYLQSLVLTK